MQTYVYIYTHVYTHTQVQMNGKQMHFNSMKGIPDLCGFNDSFLPSFTFYDGHWKVKCKARELELETTKNQMNLL